MADTGKRSTYHHGQLRRALLDVALDLATTRGIHNFTLRELARQAGVSHAAPYHHFADKQALISALAMEIFQTFTAALKRAWEETDGPPNERFSAVGAAYVRFALANPAVFRLMFRADLYETARDSTSAAGDAGVADHTDTSVMEAGQEAFEVLLGSVRECQEVGLIAAGDPLIPALAAWSMVHGLATLLLDGVLGPQGTAASQDNETLITSVLSTLRDGIFERPTA